MKKYLLYIPVAFALFGMASCSQDRDPKFKAPTSFHLNTPPMQDQEIILTPEGTLEFSCSQPDYGFAASASYSMQMALSDSFTDYYDVPSMEEHNAKITVHQSDVATGFCKLMGIDSEETSASMYPDGYPVTKIYFRAVCQISGVAASLITSNVVSYNYLQPYFAVPVPGYIYLVGVPSGWSTPDESQVDKYANFRLFEDADAIGSKIYKGVFEIGAGDDAMFRFYTALTGWDNDSYGVQEPDEAVQFPEFASGTFEHQLVKGKGSFWFPNWPGGEMTMVVNMSDPSNMTVTFAAGAVEVFTPSYIYMMGSLQGWTEPTEANASAYSAFRMANSAGAKGIYTGDFKVAEDQADVYIRFTPALEGWDGTQYGVQEEDASIDVSLTNNSFSGPYVIGKGSWHFNTGGAGTLSVSVDTDNQTVDFAFTAD